MKIIRPHITLDEAELAPAKLKNIERAARLCYKSESRMGDAASEQFLRNIIKAGHESVIEHEKATVCFVVDRGVSHEIVRHRIGSYSQESTRYCNYAGDKFGNEITVIEPFFYGRDEALYAVWERACLEAERSYLALLEGSAPEAARSVLPNSLKTELAVTYDMREWRHFFRLRCAQRAHPQMQQVAIPLLLKFREYLPPLFDDIAYNEAFPPEFYGATLIFS
ncbi:MAG: FAD-dependent thymidylate synthase [Firmicutes bacterium]|nr:FAD-dependent thymidylate synthase [Bacillota bacterium]